MPICDSCKEWLSRAINSRLDMKEAPRKLKLGTTVYQIIHEINLPHDIDLMKRSHLTCWFCSRFWNILRCLATIRDSPMPSNEGISFILRAAFPSGTLPITARFIESSGTPPSEILSVCIQGGYHGLNFDYANPYNIHHINLDVGDPSYLRSKRADSRPFKLYENHRLYLSSSGSKKEVQWTQVGALDKMEHPNSDSGNIRSFLEERIPQIEAWIKNCGQFHSCIQHYFEQDGVLDDQQAVHVPKRLIEVRKDSKQVKIVLTSTLADRENLRYATLSHCWGPAKFGTLCMANLDRAMNGFDITELGPTFREAVLLCQKLLIKYLWIDSWCILQDSERGSEWEEEAPFMDHIYGYSYLNIAATSSKSCFDGMVRQTQPQLASDINIKLTNSHLAFQSTWNGKCGLLEELFNRSALLNRGWVMQEIYLTPRTLHVTDVEMYWLCQHRFRSELSGIESSIPIRWNSINLDNTTEGGLGLDLDRRWERLAQKYSSTQVTLSPDRLYAFSCLTAFFHIKYKSIMEIDTQFIVGCWRHNFLRWLCWRSRDSTSRRANQHRSLPSWSWLSYPGPISFVEIREDFVLEMITTVKRIDFDLVKPKFAYGPVKYANVCVSAPIFVISMLNRCSHGRMKALHTPEVFFLLTSSSHNVILIGDYRVSGSCTINHFLDYNEDDAWSDPLICVWVSQQINHRQGRSLYHGLLLCKLDIVSSGEPKRYRRAGMIEVSCTNSTSDHGREIISFFQFEKFPLCDILIE